MYLSASSYSRTQQPHSLQVGRKFGVGIRISGKKAIRDCITLPFKTVRELVVTAQVILIVMSLRVQDVNRVSDLYVTASNFDSLLLNNEKSLGSICNTSPCPVQKFPGWRTLYYENRGRTSQLAV